MKPDINMPLDMRARWSRNNFDLIAIGGVWGVPRSGLIFLKDDASTLKLIALMPWTEAMGKGFEWGLDVPPTKEKLIEFQRADFKVLAEAHEAAGIKITDPKGLLL